MDLNTIWFVLIGVLLTGYAVLDGFDLGVGILHLFARTEDERKLHFRAIGPVWDGNEVWLLTGGGALFAAFPPVYASVFSGLYLAFMLVLVALILRATAIEFRRQFESPLWRRAWDYAFGIGSLLAVVLFGVAFGNLARGLPVASDGSIDVPFLALLNPFSLMVGVMAAVLATMHGAAYLALKADGDVQARSARWVQGAWAVFVVLYLAATFAAYFVARYLFEGALRNPLAWLALIILCAAFLAIPLATQAKRHGLAFLASCALTATIMFQTGVGLYPRLVPSRIALDHSLTIYNASSTPRTLLAMLIIALIGVPIMLCYTAFVYHTFRGKVDLAEEEGY